MARDKLTTPDAVQEPLDLQWLMQQPQFRRFMARAIAAAGIMTPAHRLDERHLAYSEGRRALVLEMLTKLQAADAGALVRLWSEPINQPKEPPRDKRNDDPFRDIRDDDDEPDGAA